TSVPPRLHSEHPMQGRNAVTLRACGHDERAPRALDGPVGPRAAVVLDCEQRPQLRLDLGSVLEREAKAVGHLVAVDPEAFASTRTSAWSTHPSASAGGGA